MAQAIGASVRNMYAGEVSLPITPPRTLIHGILVNGQGQRFINEDTYMGRVGQSALYEQDGEVYLIVDEASYEVNWMGLAATWVCETAAQLESEIGLPAGSLQSTVDLYNRHAAAGEDPLFHKDPSWVRPLVPPIGAVDLRIGPAPYAPFTLGGLETTVDGEVCDLTGSPIGGLFAAGRTTSGRLLVRLRQRSLHRGQHAVRPLRRRQRCGRRTTVGLTRAPGARPRSVRQQRRCPSTSSSSTSATSGSVTLMVCMPRRRAGLRLTPRSSRNTDSSVPRRVSSQASS